MTRTVYVLENRTGTPGSFFVDGKQYPLYPGEMMTVKKTPTSITGNISKSIYLEEYNPPKGKETTDNSNKGDK